MAKERGKNSFPKINSYYTKPDNIVDLIENSVARFASRNLFSIKNRETDKYE